VSRATASVTPNVREIHHHVDSLERAHTKLGRLKGTEHQELYLNYRGSEVFVQLIKVSRTIV
jgi:hypothetical protein